MKIGISLLAAIFAATSAFAQHDIVNAQNLTQVRGSSSTFTGNVTTQNFVKPDNNSKYSGTVVTFAPTARTFWHTHPAGQRLIVVEGSGFVGNADGTAQSISVGDIVWCPPQVKHFHAAKENTLMKHIALTNDKDGKTVDWLEEVSDSQYDEFLKKVQ